MITGPAKPRYQMIMREAGDGRGWWPGQHPRCRAPALLTSPPATRVPNGRELLPPQAGLRCDGRGVITWHEQAGASG
jgi:hypothetical protein